MRRKGGGRAAAGRGPLGSPFVWRGDEGGLGVGVIGGSRTTERWLDV